MAKKEYIERGDIEKWLLTETASLDGEEDKKCVVERLRNDIPAADVVDGESYRELLKAARKMHCWIFLNTADELDAYDECGLTDEMNALLGYGGQFTANMDGGVNDAAD